MPPRRRQLILRHLSLLITALASSVGTSTTSSSPSNGMATTTSSAGMDHADEESIRVVKHPLLPSSAGEEDIRREKEKINGHPQHHRQHQEEGHHQSEETQRELEDEVDASGQMNATQVAVHAQLRFFLGHNADSQEAAAQINSHIRRFAPTNSDPPTPIFEADPNNSGGLFSDHFVLQTIKLAQQRDSTSALLWSFANRQAPVLMFFDTSNTAV